LIRVQLLHAVLLKKGSDTHHQYVTYKKTKSRNFRPHRFFLTSSVISTCELPILLMPIITSVAELIRPQPLTWSNLSERDIELDMLASELCGGRRILRKGTKTQREFNRRLSFASFALGWGVK
jgi:hypothetical protein